MSDIESHRDEIIALALSDEVSFAAIRERFGLDESDLKRHMRAWLKPGSYRAWRERVKRFRAVHSDYKKPSGRRGASLQCREAHACAHTRSRLADRGR